MTDLALIARKTVVLAHDALEIDIESLKADKGASVSFAEFVDVAALGEKETPDIVRNKLISAAKRFRNAVAKLPLKPR